MNMSKIVCNDDRPQYPSDKEFDLMAKQIAAIKLAKKNGKDLSLKELEKVK